MHYNVNVTVRYTSVLFGKGVGISKEFFGDGRVDVFDVEYGEGVLVFVLYGSKPVGYGCRVFPLGEAGFSSYCGVDVLQELFANSPELAFGRVNKSASGFVLEVVFMVLECYKSLSFGHTFCPVVNVQISGDVFGFVVNSVSVGFLVGRCDAVHDQLVVRGFVHFVEVGCFVDRYNCFRKFVDFPDIML